MQRPRTATTRLSDGVPVLGFPEKFELAQQFVEADDSPLRADTSVSASDWLLLDALVQQATRGENTTLRVVSYLQDHDAGRAPRSLDDAIAARAAARAPPGGGGGGRDALARVEWVRSARTGEPVLGRAELRDALRAADAFALPTRGEGFNLPAAEAMAMGLRVIVTNFSGPTDFANDANALPLARLAASVASAAAWPLLSAARCSFASWNAASFSRAACSARETATSIAAA